MEKTIKICLLCKQEIKNRKLGHNVKYCILCRDKVRKQKAKNWYVSTGEVRRAKQRRYYDSVKDSPAYKKKTQERTNKWIDKNRGRFNKLMKEQYFKHKDRWDARNRLNMFIREGYIQMEKKCKECGSTYKLWKKFDVFPYKKEDFVKAIDEGKIRYLCKECYKGKY